jgi:hypothetical protein
MVSHSKLESLDQVAGVLCSQSVGRLVGWVLLVCYNYSSCLILTSCWKTNSFRIYNFKNTVGSGSQIHFTVSGITLVILRGSEDWPIIETNKRKIEYREMRFLRQ